ncbi:hypothetical protein CU098_000732, partial [Rhizopus stolonifer]
MLATGQAKMNAVKPKFKEKFAEQSESLFRERFDTSEFFWDNYLILPINTQCIAHLFSKTSEESLLALKHNFSALFLACLEKLELVVVETVSEKTRQQHAILLLKLVFRHLFLKKRLSHFNIIFIMTGFDEADAMFTRLMKAIQRLIEQPSTRSNALQLALVLSAGSDNVNQNGLNGYFISNDMSVSLFNTLAELEEIQQENDTRDIMMLIGMLSNYNKYEARNPYLLYLKQVKQKKALENIIQMYTSTLLSLQSRYIELYDDEETLSKTLVTYMSRWFSASTPAAPSEADNLQSLTHLPSAQTALLLPLFDLIHTNIHFVHTLIRVCIEEDKEKKTNCLNALLSFASYLFENNRTERTQIYARLLLTLLLRLMEENAVLNYMAKTESWATVRLCRQRSPTLPLMKSPRSLFCAVLDTMLLFVRHNIRNKLDLTCYKLAFSVIHRILSFLNKHKMRLEYHWTELWSTWTSILHFTALKLDYFVPRDEFGAYLASLMCVFNMCVTHGETFLTDTKSYDSLYYEIVRAASDFIRLSDHVQQARAIPKHERTALSITYHEFHNIKLICNHFQPALDEWQAMKGVKFPTPEQVM